jgi:hypothetical protein
MFKHLLDFSSWNGWASVSTVFFFVLFAGLLLGVHFLTKSHTTRMSQLPLEDAAVEAPKNGE